MIKTIFIIITAIHGLIHTLGFVKAFNFTKVEQLVIPISRPLGALWLLSAILFLFSAFAFATSKSWWGFVVIPAILLSQILIILSWSDARFGTIPNIIILLVAVVSIGSFFIQNQFELEAKADLSNNNIQTSELLSENDIAHLPAPVQKYLRYTGAIGKSKPQNIYIEFEAEMYKKPGDKPMKAHSIQYNFYGNYSRYFLMKASQSGIPFSALHVYKNNQASFQVKVGELFKIVNIKDEELTKAETVTLLNDMCIFAPGSLVDKRLSWKEIDSISAKVTLTNGKYVVSAMLCFNELGELVNFVSDDRSALQDDGTQKQVRWTTPVSHYKEFEERRVPTVGKTIWNYPEGDFMYGAFNLKSIKYNVNEKNLKNEIHP